MYGSLEIIEAIKTRLFTEDDGGYVPVESTMALATGAFKVAGEVFASSIAQGGPAPGCLCPWVYHYLCHGMQDLDLKNQLSHKGSKNSPFSRTGKPAVTQLHG